MKEHTLEYIGRLICLILVVAWLGALLKLNNNQILAMTVIGTMYIDISVSLGRILKLLEEKNK